MHHFQSFSEADREALFFRQPEEFNKFSDKQLISASLGATLYIPATRKDLFLDIQKVANKNASSVVVCLEDSIPDDQLEFACNNLHKLLHRLSLLEQEEKEKLPLIFVRPRSPEHFKQITSNVTTVMLDSLTGFIFPKFDGLTNGADFIIALQDLNLTHNLRLYYMPVLETSSIIHRETRKVALNGTMKVIAQSIDDMLAVRIGATDMSSNYGLRRSPDFTIYDVHVVASAIADIVNVFGRAEDSIIISGAVWEHFAPNERSFKPQLRESLFVEDKSFRREILSKGYDMFIREIQLDKLNGITGKTVIHPSHISFVHALQVVTHEEYSDAISILDSANGAGGALASEYKNKMNEIKPHHAWAVKIIDRAQMFGVSNKNIDFVEFLERD